MIIRHIDSFYDISYIYIYMYVCMYIVKNSGQTPGRDLTTFWVFLRAALSAHALPAHPPQ